MAMVNILSNGTILGVYDDEIYGIVRDKEFGGRTHIQRASHVEFSNEQQAWFITMLENSQLDIPAFQVGPFTEREKALDWESIYLNHRLTGISDLSARRLAEKALT